MSHGLSFIFDALFTHGAFATRHDMFSRVCDMPMRALLNAAARKYSAPLFAYFRVDIQRRRRHMPRRAKTR